MAKYFSAQIWQEYSNIVRELALNSNVPPNRIVFKNEGCTLGSIGVYIKFDDEDSLNEFSKKVRKIPCIIKRW